MKFRAVNISPGSRWFVAIVWTMFLLVMLIKPGELNDFIEPSFNSFMTSFFSYKLTVWDVLEMNFHILLFIILTGVWFWVFDVAYGKNKALVMAFIIAFVIGLTTEIMQYFVGRSSRLFDLLANYLGIMLFYIWIRHDTRYKSG